MNEHHYYREEGPIVESVPGVVFGPFGNEDGGGVGGRGQADLDVAALGRAQRNVRLHVLKKLDVALVGHLNNHGGSRLNLAPSLFLFSIGDRRNSLYA